MSGLRVLHYNVQFRSWGMEAGAQGTPFPTTSVEERARTIARRILQSPQQYDVLCFNEVFDEDGRDVLEDELIGSYPNAVLKADNDEAGGLIKIAAGAALLAAPGIGWLAGIGLIWSGLTTHNFEDSGIMLFSRLPFATLPTPPELAELLTGLGQTPPATIPIVAFVPYEDADGGDGNAAKGVLYARLVRPGGSLVHLLASHMQADSTTAVGEHEETREKQFAQVWQLLEQMVGPAPFTQEVLFCGDFNVDGWGHVAPPPPGQKREWQNLFTTPGSHWTDHLRDTWYQEQCPGRGLPGGTPLPDDCDPGLTTHLQRLDYALRPPPYPGRLATQHLAIAYDVAQAAPGQPGTAYTSDHLPLRIDLGPDHPGAGAAAARKVPPPPAATPDEDVLCNSFLAPGAMDWWRIDEPGAYGFGLDDGPPHVAFEIYTTDNLSIPVRPFSLTAESPGRELPPVWRYVLPRAPFFIRIFAHDRDREANYRLRVHRYQGTSRLDAIPLGRGIPMAVTFKDQAPHSLDLAATPSNEHDTLWCKAWLDQPAEGQPTLASHVTLTDAEEDVFATLVLQEEPGGDLRPLAEQGRGPAPLELAFDHDEPRWAYILIRREDPGFQVHKVTVTLTTEVSFLYGNPNDPGSRPLGPGRLFCEDETDGLFGNEWGSDDISLNVNAAGRTLLHIGHSDDFDFDDDSLRDLPFSIVRYPGDAQFELVELDDLSPVDRASVTLPAVDGAAAAAKHLIRADASSVYGSYRIVFENDDGDEDGIYNVTLTISREPPPGP